MNRESIWSPVPGAQRVYFGLFAVQIGVAVILLLCGEEDISWTALLAAWGKLGPVATASAAVAIAATEIGAYIMVLAKGLYDKIERQRQERREEARREAHREMRELLARVLNANPGKSFTAKELDRLIEEELRGAA